MGAALYQLFALGARYLFIILALLVVLRASRSLLHEHHERKKILKKLPDAGKVGELRDIETGSCYPLPREGVLGGGHAADVRIRGLRRRTADVAFVDGKGLLITPCRRGANIQLDGEDIGRGVYALHNSVLTVGNRRFLVRLFAGLSVPRSVRWQAAAEEDLYAPDNRLTEGIVFCPPVYEETGPLPVMNAPVYAPQAYEAPQYEEEEPAEPSFRRRRAEGSYYDAGSYTVQGMDTSVYDPASYTAEEPECPPVEAVYQPPQYQPEEAVYTPPAYQGEAPVYTPPQENTDTPPRRRRSERWN